MVFFYGIQRNNYIGVLIVLAIPFAIRAKWFEAIKNDFASSLNIEQDDLEEVPSNTLGGLGRAYELFGEELGKILNEMNQYLAA